MYILIIMLLLFISVELLIYKYGKKQDEISVDYIVVLGAGLYGDKLSSALQRRLDVAIAYAQKHPSTPIVVSGGQGAHETVSEAYAMQQYLMSQQIQERRILLEDKSTSTHTNFLYTKHLLKEDHLKVMICTCDFHMYRSCRIAKKLGFCGYRYPAKSTKLICIKYYVREFFCVIKNWLTNH